MSMQTGIYYMQDVVSKAVVGGKKSLMGSVEKSEGLV